MEAYPDFVKLHEDELCVEVEIRVDCFFEYFEVVKDVLDELGGVVLDVFGELALEQAVVGLNQIEQPPDEDDFVLSVLLG